MGLKWCSAKSDQAVEAVSSAVVAVVARAPAGLVGVTDWCGGSRAPGWGRVSDGDGDGDVAVAALHACGEGGGHSVGGCGTGRRGVGVRRHRLAAAPGLRARKQGAFFGDTEIT